MSSSNIDSFSENVIPTASEINDFIDEIEVGIATFFRDCDFYNLNSGIDENQAFNYYIKQYSGIDSCFEYVHEDVYSKLWNWRFGDFEIGSEIISESEDD